jgi:sirohydrochlorin ferrochelatase
MSKRVLVVARDLMFRSKLRTVITTAGGDVAADETACDLAVVEIEAPQWESRIRALVERGIPVLAFGSHVHADLLRQARDAGARAVPNSQVESVLRVVIGVLG